MKCVGQQQHQYQRLFRSGRFSARRMTCSAVTLSLATIGGVVAVTLIAIGFGTDNWTEVRVNRAQVRSAHQVNSDRALDDKYKNDKSYYNRDVGLFRECFPNDRPKSESTYISPTETYCMNIDYHIPEDNTTINYSDDEWAWLHMGRACISMFICGFFWVGVAFITGVAGCWCRSSGRIVSTGILMLVAGLFCAGGMGLWHGKEYYERSKLKESPFYNSWDKALKQNVMFNYGWSYIIAWIGIGWCLISAILFFCAAKCLHEEKMKEQAKNMQYLMPTYPTKQQYGYGYAYPGPYYNHGSQYGPYNY